MPYSCSIIAYREGRGFGFAERIYEELRNKGSEKKFELNEVEIKKFRDGEIKPKIKSNVRRKRCFFIHDSSLDPFEWIAQLLLINETLRNSSAEEIIDVFPYLRFSRQDRKDESRVPISARAIASLVNSYADRALTIDVHNPSIQGFYKIFDNLYSFPLVTDYLKKRHGKLLEDLVIMSPDAGGAKRAEAFAKRINGLGVVVGYKTRPREGEVSSIELIGDVKRKDVLIVDDILDSGNTLIEAYRAIKRAGGEKVYVYVTHALFTCGIGNLVSCFDKIFVGNTVPNVNKYKNKKIEVIDFAPLFAEAIYRIDRGESLSELFE